MIRFPARFLAVVAVMACMSACATTRSSTPEAVSQSSNQAEVFSHEAGKTRNRPTQSKTYSNLAYGKLAPLIGEWQVRDWQLQKDGQWLEQNGAKWHFYPIQGGASLQDDWVSNVSSSDKQPGYGTHIRVYDPLGKSWEAAWLSSRNRTVDIYSGTESESEVLFSSQPDQQGRITRTVFSNIQPDFFNWRMEWSNDGGQSWLMVYKVDATRLQ